jgi:phenylacetate-CoA ligase
VFDHAGMTEAGAWGFETVDAPGGLFVNETEFIAEVIDPATGAIVADGAMGELVLTNLGRLGSPLIRYRTGDLVQFGRAAPANSIQNPISKIQNHGTWCLGGVLGRVDDMLIIRGNNVFPSAIEGILRTVPGVAEFRITVAQQGALGELRIEIERRPDIDAAALRQAAEKALRDRLSFRPDVLIVEPDTLPRFEMKAKRVIR